jgi:hypothetical protein
MSVDGVLDATNIAVTFNKQTRQAVVALDVITAEETFREEVPVNV